MPDSVTELELLELLAPLALEQRLLTTSMLATAALPCDSCGWPTSIDRRQLELAGVDVAGVDMCARCTARLRAVY